MPEFNPSRLDFARRRRGLTKAQLATLLGLTSPRMLSAYGSGEKRPSRGSLLLMSEVLSFPQSFFFGPDLEEPSADGTTFRAMTRLSAKQREQGLASGALALLLSDWIDSRFRLPEVGVPRFSGLDPEMAAVAVRSEWGLGERPIKNMVHVLEAHGVRVFSLTEDCVEMDAFSFWRGERPFVFLNTMKSSERSRMDAAHELGHLVLHWAGRTEGSSRGGTREAEREADQFASAFLMPKASILGEVPRNASLSELVRLKRRWNVSIASLVLRMHRVRLLSEWQYRAHFMEISKKGWRIREPNGSQPETSKVLDQVLEMAKEDGLSRADIAAELDIYPDELAKIVFGLTLTALPAGGNPVPTPSAPAGRPNLRIV